MRKGIVVVLLVFSCLTYMSAQRVNSGMVPSGKGYGIPSPNVVEGDPNAVVQGNGINWHGGSIIPNTVNVYYIWYGNWKGGPKPSDSPTTVQLLQTFARGIGATPFFNILTTYGDTTDNVTGNVHFAKQTTMLTYPNGKNLTDASILKIVSGALPSDTNGVYFVFTTSDVNETSGFCTSYCGWHTNGTVNGADIKYSFIGNPDRCPTSCEGQSKGPNSDNGADGIANIMSHELSEATTDPDLSAWWQTATGEEVGDLCAWKWGTLLGGTLGNGGYNETFGGKNWFLQMEWENSRKGGCDNFLGGPFHTK